MRQDDCIFCKIANGEIPATEICENEGFRVILDLGPASKGHALVLPKEHYRDITELPEKAGQTVFHFHIHVIPRYEGGPEMVAWTPGKAEAEELKATAESIRKAL